MQAKIKATGEVFNWIDKMEFNTREVCVYAHTYYDMAERSLAIADEMIKQLKEG